MADTPVSEWRASLAGATLNSSLSVETGRVGRGLFSCLPVGVCVFGVAHLLLEGCYSPGELASMSSSNPDTCGCVCVCVCSGVGPAPNLCFGVFNFNPIWAGQVGHCLLHDPGEALPKRGSVQ